MVGGSIPSAPATIHRPTFATIMANPFRSIRIFSGELLAELKKADWPTKAELKDSTIVVIVACLLLGVFTSISDFALYNFVDAVTTLVSR